MEKLGWVLVFALACGPAETTEEPPPDDTTGQETTEDTTEASNTSGIRERTPDEFPSPPKAWEEMSAEERGQYMGASVMPYFRDLFNEYDGERYATVNCETCHGATMNERNFEMPNPDILPLHASGTPEQRAMVEEHPRMVRFMFNHVVPAMRNALGAPEFDAETGEGFSCYYCHTHAEEGEPAAEGEPAK